jgi:hypothetical protein
MLWTMVLIFGAGAVMNLGGSRLTDVILSTRGGDFLKAVTVDAGGR